MKYAPLPWVHLSEALRPSLRRLRVVLEPPVFSGERTFVRLYDGPRSKHVTDARQLLDGQTPISARERAALEILREAGPSHAKKGRFSLTRAQLGRLLTFATDVALEVESRGALNLIPSPAHLAGRVREDEEGRQLLIFEAVDSDTAAVATPRVLGEREAFLLDEDQLKLYRIAPPLLPGEADALLEAEPLDLAGLTTEEGTAGFRAVVGLGVDLADLVEVTKQSDPAPKVVLRALLGNADNGEVQLRVHLVTELGAGPDVIDEVEVTSRHALPPVHAIEAAEGPDAPPHLIGRPTNLEEQARQSLFDMGLHAAANHQGFTATGEDALDLLVRLADRDGLPDYVEVDPDTLPRIVRLPDVPVLSIQEVRDKREGNLLSVRLDIGEEARALAVDFSSIVESALRGHRGLLLDDDVVLGFTNSGGKSLDLIASALELDNADSERLVGHGEVALLVAAVAGKVNLACSDEVRDRINAFFAEVNEKDREIPGSINVTLRPYQEEGVSWLSRLHRLGLGRILADDMGLGKTIMAMTLLAKAKESDGRKPNLVVAPTSVIDVWVDEAARHAPSLNVVKWHGRDRAGLEEVASETDIVVTSYALLRRDVDGPLGELDFRYLMLDEAQHVKNRSTEAWKAARQVRCDQRLALTGTPIENRVEELWSIMELVAPGLLGTAKNFEKRYARPISKGDPDRLNELRRRTKPVILRRKKEDVAKDLPPKIETVMRCEMDDSQRGLYLRVLAEVQDDVQKALSIHTKSRARAPILAALMKLRQCCCDPRLVSGEDTEDIGSTKLDLFKEVIQEILDGGRRVIVFSQFVEMQKLLHKALEELGVTDSLWLHGGTRKRGEVVAKFQDPDGPPVIVVSLKAGGTGLTLTAADTVIHYDPWWNPAVEDQATDRAHRIGQEKTVHVIRLACADSIEERMLALSDDKRQAAENVLGRDGPGPKSLTLDEIRGLIDAEINRGF